MKSCDRLADGPFRVGQVGTEHRPQSAALPEDLSHQRVDHYAADVALLPSTCDRTPVKSAGELAVAAGHRCATDSGEFSESNQEGCVDERVGLTVGERVHLVDQVRQLGRKASVGRYEEMLEGSRAPQLLDRPHLYIVRLSDRPRADASSGSEARSEEQAAVNAAGQLEKETVLFAANRLRRPPRLPPDRPCSRLSVRSRDPSRPCRCGARPEVNDLAAAELANSSEERPPGDEVPRCCPLRRRLEIEFGSQ